MATYVLDASAILRFGDKEAGFDRVRDLFIEAAQGKAELLLSAVNWGEIVGALYKRAGGLSALTNTLAANLAALPLTIVPADKDLAASAAIFKDDFKVPFVDAFAGSLAVHENATLVDRRLRLQECPIRNNQDRISPRQVATGWRSTSPPDQPVCPNPEPRVDFRE